MMDGEEFSPVLKTEPFTCERLGLSTPKKRKSNSSSSNNSRRFSDEQIKSLESLFKLENKLEPRKKLQMARELGLQPRQVAIWFQNRRARWKSKQMEQEYRALKADYDSLNSKFELLKKEKKSLLLQLKNLCGESKNLEGNGTDSGSENGETNFELNGISSSLDGGLEQGMIIYSDDEERTQVQSMDEQVDGFSEPPERSNVFDISGLFDQPCSTSEWWNVWS